MIKVTNKKKLTRGIKILLALVFLNGELFSSVSQGPLDQMMERGVKSYRSGNLYDALVDMTSVLERDPSNSTAKNYIWTISSKIKKENVSMTLKEKKEAVLLALAHLGERQKNSEETLKKLKKAYGKSKNIRSPEDVLSGMVGMDQYLGKEFESERISSQAESYFNRILSNLSVALEKKSFVSQKDEYNAKAYLAYYTNNWKEAIGYWKKALKEDPDDESIRSSLDQVISLVKKKRHEAKINELVRQAETYQKTAYIKVAAKIWKKILKFNPHHIVAQKNYEICRVEYQKEEKNNKLKSLTKKGIKLYREKKYTEAVDVWLKVLQLDPTYDQARVWISYVGNKLQKVTKQKELLLPKRENRLLLLL